MATFEQKRKRITKMVLDVAEILAGGKHDNNYERLDIFLNSMSDTDFETWAKWCNNPDDPTQLDHTIQLFYDNFDIPKYDNIKKALDSINVPIEEFVYYRDTDPKGVRTKVPVPVGYLNIKREQQMISKKNKYTIDTDKIDAKTGQVRDESKAAAIAPEESIGLISMGADKIMQELFGPRAANQKQKQDMYRQIARNGFYDMSQSKEKDDDLTKHTALNTLNTYLLASGLRSDLIVDSLKTSYTIKSEYEMNRNR